MKKTTAEIQSIASNLYDGGWRAADKDQIAKEYEYTADDADELDAICAELEQYEEKELKKQD